MVILRNLTSKSVYLAPGRCVAWVAAANEVPQGATSPELLKKLDEQEPLPEEECPKLTIEEQQKLLMELLWEDRGLE